MVGSHQVIARQPQEVDSQWQHVRVVALWYLIPSQVPIDKLGWGMKILVFHKDNLREKVINPLAI